MIDAIRDHPGQGIALLVTLIGLISGVIWISAAIGDVRGTREEEHSVRFIARFNLQIQALTGAVYVIAFLLTLRQLVTVEDTLKALPPPLRAAALARMRHLTTAQMQTVVLYTLLILLLISLSSWSLWQRRQFRRKYPRAS